MEYVKIITAKQEARMTLFKMLLATTMVIFSATLAFAQASVYITIDGQGANYSLNSMQVDTEGDITLDVSSGGTTPSQLTLGLNPNTLTSGTVNTPYGPVNVTMTAGNGTSPYTYSCSGSGVGSTGLSISATPSGATAGSATCTITGTPTTAGSATVTFTAVDSASEQINITRTFTIVNPSSGGNDIGARYPNMLNDQIGPNASKEYTFAVDGNFQDVTMTMLGYWGGNVDMIVNRGSQPRCQDIVGSSPPRGSSGPWYSITAGTNESVSMNNINATSGEVFYVTLCNRTSATTKYSLYWSAGNW
jgi:hypothetical protein